MPLFQGEAQTEVFTLIQSSPSKPTKITIAQEGRPFECCFGLPAFGETVFTDEFNNDLFSVLTFWDQSFTGAVITLQTFTAGTWNDLTTITDNTYGTFSAFGFNNIAPEQNIFQENGIGFLVDWRLVLIAFDSGRYRFKTTGTTFSSLGVDNISLDFCLEEFSDFKVNNSVRIEWFLNGNIGDEDDDTKKKDYGMLNWYNQLRLPDSMFGNDKSEFEREYLKLDTGVNIWLTDTQIESYLLRTGQLSNEVHRLIKVNILQADEILITDYSTVNPTPHTQRSVTPTGGYEPQWVNGIKKSRVEVEFQQAIQNWEHKRC